MELIDIYDDLGQKCEISEDKDEAHRKALIHRGVCVWIMNSKNELLLQTRSDHVMFPNMQDISFSGHIQAGETSIEAARREGREELGINVDEARLKYLFSCREYGGVDSYFENEIDDVFLYRADIPINEYSFCDNEVKEVRYIPLDEFKMMVESNSPMLMPYETHYHFLLTTLNSRLIQWRNGTNMFLRSATNHNDIPFEIKRSTPNVETMATMDEYEEMKKDPDKYKRYEFFDELLDEVLSDA